MWKFKPSKYKNAAPSIHKDHKGISISYSITSDKQAAIPNVLGNSIDASAAFVAFNINYGSGGSLGLVHFDDLLSGNEFHTLNAHSDWITDFQFCPYDDGLLATGSLDSHVKIWRVSHSSKCIEIPSNPSVDLLLNNRIEALTFHPATDCVLTTAESNSIRLWDISSSQQILQNVLDDQVQSMSWKLDGEFIACSSKDKTISVFDPRVTTSCQKIKGGSESTKVLWLGDTNYVLTSGFGRGRQREVFVHDFRNISEPIFSYYGESSTGILLPYFDPDTNMIFFASKGDAAISFWELTEKSPFLVEANTFVGNIRIRGAAMVPKRGMRVMEGEVNRVIVLGPDSIVPVSYIIPRKSYREFHSDIFPNTRAAIPSMQVSNWLEGENKAVPKISLDPSCHKKDDILSFNHELGGTLEKLKIKEADDYIPSNENENLNLTSLKNDNLIMATTTLQHEESQLLRAQDKPLLAPKPASPKVTAKSFKHNMPTDVTTLNPVSSNSSNVRSSDLNDNNPPAPKPSTPEPRRPKRTIVRATKFRYVNGVILPKETHITDVTSLTRTVPGESDGFSVNREFVAFPMGNDGGLIALLKLAAPGRCPSLADVPGVLCGTKCMDFTWDPFDSHRLVTACDDGVIQIWDINENSVTEKIDQPSFTLRGVTDKVSIVKFHPCAKDVLCSAGSDLCLHVWDVAFKERKICLKGHQDQILGLAWSPNGEYIATVSKDQRLRIFDPRSSSVPIKEGTGPEGIRGARVVWVLGGTHLVVSGFNKVSERQLYLYDCNDISSPIGDYGLDVSPATLIPFYDEDSSTLFLSGKGDATVYAFEVATDLPYFHPLSHYKCSGPHQALSFLPKIVCDVKKVEFARAIRLTTSSIEPLSFYVPRLRMEYFQDDIFPNTKETWNSTFASKEWFEGENKAASYISLRPSDMELLSEAPPPEKTVTEKQAPVNIVFKGDVVLESSLAFLQNSKEKEEKIKQSMNAKCEFQQNSLPQDSFDGVEPEEWDEEERMHALQDQ